MAEGGGEHPAASSDTDAGKNGVSLQPQDTLGASNEFDFTFENLAEEAVQQCPPEGQPTDWLPSPTPPQGPDVLPAGVSSLLGHATLATNDLIQDSQLPGRSPGAGDGSPYAAAASVLAEFQPAQPDRINATTVPVHTGAVASQPSPLQGTLPASSGWASYQVDGSPAAHTPGIALPVGHLPGSSDSLQAVSGAHLPLQQAGCAAVQYSTDQAYAARLQPSQELRGPPMLEGSSMRSRPWSGVRALQRREVTEYIEEAVAAGLYPHFPRQLQPAGATLSHSTTQAVRTSTSSPTCAAAQWHAGLSLQVCHTTSVSFLKPHTHVTISCISREERTEMRWRTYGP